MTSIGFKEIDMSVEAVLAISPSDHLAITIVGVAWAGTAYVLGMIWTSLALIDRWRGTHGEGNINFVSVIAALIMAAAWPIVLAALIVM
ncbi:hypothetical protein KVR01_000089 [Diaporthe batatas]|uniref:uncharacterized protein n=1 Tax=Diaporthe batatas TaxID=748121 RepID=UPI001D03B264|nr:uncharacterized protein KVR01_000089 [Diaporthe batatas]KAG8169344.1 hypothetical protein KVR01_000089 [Diaporthe batatas]